MTAEGAGDDFFRVAAGAILVALAEEAVLAVGAVLAEAVSVADFQAGAFPVAVDSLAAAEVFQVAEAGGVVTAEAIWGVVMEAHRAVPQPQRSRPDRNRACRDLASP